MTATAAQRVNRALARSLAPRKATTTSAWADDKRILSSKGSAKPGRWVTATNPPLREPMDFFSVRNPARIAVVMFQIQFGKALALDTPVATPAGWSTMGGLQAGDTVFDDRGQPTRVVVASEVFHDHRCYRVEFSDGAVIVADAGHRWTVDNERHYHRTVRETLTTEHIAATFKHGRQHCYAIPLAAPLELPEVDLPIDPYTLGAWLGDGNSASAQLTLFDADAAEIVARIEAAGCRCVVRKLPHDVARGAANTNVMLDPKATTVGASFHLRLMQLGVLNDKHIPIAYLRASRQQRLALLQGLMDTDGHAPADINRAVEIASSYPRLAADIQALLLSLQFKPRMRVKQTSARESACITFTAYADQQPFSLRRKAARLGVREGRRTSETLRRRIVGVVEVACVPTRCIAVDTPSHLFLAGHRLVPTHNTEIALNGLGYTMDENPGPVMVCLPGEVSMEIWVAQKLDPLLSETPAVKGTLTSVASRDGANRRAFKDFAGGQLFIQHAGSPQRLKSTSVRTLIVDELDEFAANLKSGDDPVKMLDGRTSAFPATFKRMYISSPQLEGVSRIKRMWDKSDKRRYHVPCPDCGHMQPLEWSGLHWTPDGSQCWYVCRECGVVIEEHQKTAMIAAGQWVPENPESKIRGYTSNCLYYQFGIGPRWLDMVAEWLEAQNDAAALKTFVNDRLAETWEDPAMRAVKHNLIADRAELWPLRKAPAWVLAITVGIDTQDNRLAVHILGWGRGLTCWPLDYVELPGDPAEDDVWVALTELLNRPIEHASGALMRVEAGCIDAGGHRTEAVKNYVRKKLVRRLLTIFGAKSNNAPVISKGTMVDVNFRGVLDKRGIKIHHVGTVGIKHVLYSRLSADTDKQPDARQVRFSDEFEPDYFGGLVSEIYNPTKNRFEKRKGAPRNEPLDTWVYGYAATHHPELRLHRATKADWDAREARLLAAAGKSGIDSRETSMTPAAPSIRSALDDIVCQIDRTPTIPVEPSAVTTWANATQGTEEERAVLAAMIDQLTGPPAPIAALLASALVDRARNLLRLQPKDPLNIRPTQRPARGTRHAGIK